MTNKAQNILILTITAAVIGLIVVWFFVLNTGKISVSTGLTDYKITAGGVTSACISDPCVIKLKIGSYNVEFTKEGFNSSFSNAVVKRGVTTEVNFEPKKYMELKTSSVAPVSEKPSLPLPKDLNDKNVIGYKWNADSSKLLYLDSADSRVKIRDSKDGTKLLTTLKNISPPINFYWSPDENRIIANKDKDMYLIDASAGSRKKQVLDFTFPAFLWSPDSSYFLMNKTDGSILKIDWNNAQSLQDTGLSFDLNKSVWIDGKTLVTYEFDEEQNTTRIWTYSPLEKTKEVVMQKFDFPVDAVTYTSAENTVYLRNSRENVWYEMKL
jgi:WD40 repeat protein